MFTLGFFLWNVLGNASLRADRGGPQRKIGMRAAAEWCLPGRKREKGEGIMNENVDGMMIRLVGLALAVLMMAGMTILYGPFQKDIRHGCPRRCHQRAGRPCGRRGCPAERLSGAFFKNKRGAPRSELLRGTLFFCGKESLPLWKFHKNPQLFFHFLREWG